ncbi:tyrosine-type recombinase/integrase [Desulfogranum marinum]|uniref:tyrosine-type recombinase/integrase n=1 Tax=Desulfogranum marinum TaxID=453220 RepID=UPI001964CF70|nr:site-specific integrase [Desulfogranum marinum]MBM9514730.1 tyrosine-type recombinase/integrase [Desulfogranum marinum]
MAIYARCTNCRKDNPFTSKKCTKCGNKLGSKFQVRVRDSQSGKWFTKITPSASLAKQIEAKFKVQLIEGELLNKKKKSHIRFSLYLEQAKLQKRSWRDDQNRWKNHIAPNDFKTRQGIKKILNNAKAKGLQPATINHILKLIRRVYNWHIQEGYWHQENPCKGIPLLKHDNRVNNILSHGEIDRLVSYLQKWNNRRAALAILFAIYTGRRKGEIIDLKWNNIDLERKTYTCEQTKNGSTLSFPLNAKALAVTLEAESIRINNIVFPSSTGHKYSAGLSLAWGRLRKRLGINIRFHDLRHTYASLLASSGKVDIYTLKTLLGHKDIKLTERYSHLSDTRLRQSTEVIDSLL